jgi:hypothetical protein
MVSPIDPAQTLNVFMRRDRATRQFYYTELLFTPAAAGVRS